MAADLWAWVPERARFAAARVGLGWTPESTSTRRRGSILGSTWIGEGYWCYVNTGSSEIPTNEEIPGFDESAAAHAVAITSTFPKATKAQRSAGTVYIGCAVVDARYVTLVEALWPEAIWRSRGEREPVAAFVGSLPVALLAPIADKGGGVEIRDLTRQEPDEKLLARIAELEREARRDRALRQEIERLSELGEGYASARDLRRALALEEPREGDERGHG